MLCMISAFTRYFMCAAMETEWKDDSSSISFIHMRARLGDRIANSPDSELTYAMETNAYVSSRSPFHLRERAFPISVRDFNIYNTILSSGKRVRTPSSHNVSTDALSPNRTRRAANERYIHVYVLDVHVCMYDNQRPQSRRFRLCWESESAWSSSTRSIFSVCVCACVRALGMYKCTCP